MDPATRQVQSVQVRTPRGYAFATERTACVFTDSPKDTLYVEYGGRPLATQGASKQTPVSALYAMRLRWPAMGGWKLVRVAGDSELPKRAAAAVACGPSRTAYMFGGVEDRGPLNVSVFKPTASLLRVKVVNDGVNSYQLQAASLHPSNKGPSARSGHVLLYLAPPLVRRWGMLQGALLLHGGTNLEGVSFDVVDRTTSPQQSPRSSSTTLNDNAQDRSFLTRQKGLRVYKDTWLYDIGSNKWRLLPNSSTPIPLMWHSGTVQSDNGAHQVVLFGGTTIHAGSGMQVASVSDLMLLDLSAQQLRWRTVPINITAVGSGVLAFSPPNSGICSVPGTSNYLLRQRKVSMWYLAAHNDHVSQRQLPGHSGLTSTVNWALGA